MKPKIDNKEQSERFIKKARESGADESGEVFERAFKTIVPPKRTPIRPKSKSKRRDQ